MTIQTYGNHIRFNKAYHFAAVPLMLGGIGFAIYNFIGEKTLANALLVIAFGFILLVAMFARWFALRVQDRAARAEERLRYYILTNQMLPSALRMGQILALRFASDEELVDLVNRTINENLSPKAIKQAIQNWRGDYHRI